MEESKYFALIGKHLSEGVQKDEKKELFDWVVRPRREC